MPVKKSVPDTMAPIMIMNAPNPALHVNCSSKTEGIKMANTKVTTGSVELMIVMWIGSEYFWAIIKAT